MADNFSALNAAAATVTFRSTDVGGGVQCSMSIPSNASGTTLIGQQVMGNSIPVVLSSNQSVISFNLTQINGTTVNIGQGAMTASVPVVIASDQSAIQFVGNVASGFSDSGNPVKIGAVAHTIAPTAVTDGQRVNLIADKVGKLITAGAIRDLKASQTASLTTAAETVIINALNATTYADPFLLMLANTAGTATRVDIRYGLGSAILLAVAVPGTSTVTVSLPADSALPGSIATANVSWTAQCAATTTMFVSSFYVKNI